MTNWSIDLRPRVDPPLLIAGWHPGVIVGTVLFTWGLALAVAGVFVG